MLSNLVDICFSAILLSLAGIVVAVSVALIKDMLGGSRD